MTSMSRQIRRIGLLPSFKNENGTFTQRREELGPLAISIAEKEIRKAFLQRRIVWKSKLQAPKEHPPTSTPFSRRKGRAVASAKK